MRYSFFIFAASASALSIPTPEHEATHNAMGDIHHREAAFTAGATIYKAQYRKGTYTPQDFTYVGGALGQCQDMYNLFGGWEDATRSLSVSPGFTCSFHTELRCSSKGRVLTLGKKDKAVNKDTLDKNFDRKIRSAICRAL